MIKHNFLLFFRNIKKYKSTFMINLIGLSTGLASVLLIAFWVIDELQFDTFHENDERLFQVWNKFDNPNDIDILHWTPDLLAEAMAEEFPEVQYAVPFIDQNESGESLLTSGDKKIKALGTFTGKDFFNMFSFPLLKGTKDDILKDINSIAISKSLAIQFFGSVDAAIGKSISWGVFNSNETHQISGVFDDIPFNSSLQFDFLLPFAAFKNVSREMGRDIHWDNNWPKTFVSLNEGTNSDEFASKITGFSKQKDENVRAELFLKSFSSNYLYGKFENGEVVGGRIDYLKSFTIIALIILLIACINFMNLSTANANRRSKEIAIKKAIGTKRITLAIQHLIESVLTSFLALLIALLLVYIFLPQFNTITGKMIVLSFNAKIVWTTLTIVCLTGLISGSYPAIYLSGFNPVKLLKGVLPKSIGELWVRKGLVVTQFSLSIILIFGVIIVFKQITYIQSKNLGLSKDNIISFPKEGNLKKNAVAFTEAIQSIPEVVNATNAGQNIIGTDIGTTLGVQWAGKAEDDFTDFFTLGVDYNFIETLEMEVVMGRSFSKSRETDKQGLILNEKALQVMGLKDPIGKLIRFWGEERQIIGILKDFHFQSLTQVIEPMIFRIVPDEKTYIHMVRIKAGQEKEALAQLGKVYKTFNPDYDFEYTFLDQNFQSLYASEQRVATLSKYFAVLAILISCLGLFGLVQFSSEQRKKEIGIRKTLGQSKTSITLLLSTEFVKLVGIAIVIGLPLAFLISRNWLSSFAYRIDLQLWYFLVVGIIAILIAMTTVSTQALKAANKNPIDALREE